MAEPIPVSERRRLERRINPTLAELTLPEIRRMMVTTVLFVIILVLFLWMVRTVIIATILGIIVAMYMRPVYLWLYRHIPNRVVSGTLTTTTWRNSQILGPYDAEAIRRLKNEVGDLYVSGSGTLVRAMIADSLADELHLFVYPLTRGSGPRLFTDDAAPHKLSLADSASYENGVVYLSYRPQG